MYTFNFLVFTIGLYLMNDVTHSFNPLLTYSVRYKKLTFIPNITGDYTINQGREKQTISGNFTINSFDIDSVVVIFNRCDPEGINCEYVNTWKLTDVCSLLKKKNQVWSSWYGATRPLLQCPINNTHYELVNGYIDVGPVLLIYPEATNYQWRVAQKFYAGDVLIGGFSLDYYYFGYRKRTNSILRT